MKAASATPARSACWVPSGFRDWIGFTVGVATDRFIALTSNGMAVLGLRALFFALAAWLDRFRYLKPALA